MFSAEMIRCIQVVSVAKGGVITDMHRNFPTHNQPLGSVVDASAKS
jgi:hypothetical protein